MTFKVTPEIKKTLFEKGVVNAEGLLSPPQLARLRECFDWGVANPGPSALTAWEGTVNAHHIDNGNPAAKKMYRDVMPSMPFADVLAELWGSEHVWFYQEEIFWKKGEIAGTPWHQDSSYSPWQGEHWANCWIAFERIPKANCLGIVRGTHHGPIYDGITYNLDDPTEPFWGDRADPPFPRIPDIDADRKADANRWDIATYDMEPGDVLLSHPSTIHGGAPVGGDFPERHTLVFRFFGDDATYRGGIPDGDGLFTVKVMEEIGSAEVDRALEPGDPFRHPRFFQLR